jgi:hypothetical protein
MQYLLFHCGIFVIKTASVLLNPFRRVKIFSQTIVWFWFGYYINDVAARKNFIFLNFTIIRFGQHSPMEGNSSRCLCEGRNMIMEWKNFTFNCSNLKFCPNLILKPLWLHLSANRPGLWIRIDSIRIRIQHFSSIRIRLRIQAKTELSKTISSQILLKSKF